MKVKPAPGSFAAELLALAEEERALAAREEALIDHGAETEERATGLGKRLEEARAALKGMTSPYVQDEAQLNLEKHAKLVVPGHAVSPQIAKAFDQRKKAAAARAEALAKEEEALKQRAQKLDELAKQVDGLSAKAAELTKKVADEEARQAEEARKRAEEAARKKAEAERKRKEAAEAKAREEEKRRQEAGAAGAPEERRGPKRIKLETEVNLSSESNFFAGFTGDLSEAGVYVATWEAVLEPGTEVDISLALPNRKEPLAVTGVVRWVREESDPLSGSTPGMGVAFKELAEADAELIRAFLKEREPIFWSE